MSSFNSDALISEINSIDNLIALCPTHHWEFDNDNEARIFILESI